MMLDKKISDLTIHIILTYTKIWQMLNKDHFEMHVHLCLNPTFYEKYQ